MDKENLITQVSKIYQALNAISVQGYSNIKTLGNCLDAVQELIKNINTYEADVQDMLKKQIEKTITTISGEGITPMDASKPKPKRIKKEVNTIGENQF